MVDPIYKADPGLATQRNPVKRAGEASSAAERKGRSLPWYKRKRDKEEEEGQGEVEDELEMDAGDDESSGAAANTSPDPKRGEDDEEERGKRLNIVV